MNLDRLSERCRQAMRRAKDEAARLGSSHASSEHILLALIAPANSTALTVLHNLDVDLAVIQKKTLAQIQNATYYLQNDATQFSPSGKRTIQFAHQEAQSLGVNYVGTEHLLLGVIRDTNGVAARVLLGQGVDLAKARAEVLQVMGVVRDQSEILKGEPILRSRADQSEKKGRELDQLTERAHKVVRTAMKKASQLGRSHISSEHILLGLIPQHDSVAVTALRNLGADLDVLRKETIAQIPEDPNPLEEEDPIQFSPSGKRAIQFARQEAQSLGVNFIGVEHLLLGVIRESEGIAARVLLSQGVDLVKARAEILRLMGMSESRKENLVGDPPAILTGKPIPRSPADQSEKKGSGHDRLTERARKVMQRAREEAARFGSSQASTEHVLLGLIAESESVGATALRNLGVDLAFLRKETLDQIPKAISSPENDIIQSSPSLKRAIQFAHQEAQSLGVNFIGAEHLLLGIIRESEGIAAKVLLSQRVDLAKARAGILRLMGMAVGEGPIGWEPVTQPGPGGKNKSKTPALDAFGTDLTELARTNKLDPVIGREEEIERVMQVLCRRTKNNPLLIGEAGVGKTAIAEGLAQKIVNKQVPDPLADNRLISLDLAALAPGTKSSGQFAERLMVILEEMRRCGNILLFVDQLHTLMGAGPFVGFADTSNLLKPALAHGELQCIGAATPKEYREQIKTDSTLERRFQRIIVEPPSFSQTIEILKGLRETFETHHQVSFTDRALEAASLLSGGYLRDRVLPEKAIDLIDEAGARAYMKTVAKPKDLEEMEGRIEKFNREIDAVTQIEEFEKCMDLKHRRDELQADFETKLKEWEERRLRKENRPTVDEQEIARLISEWSEIPLDNLTESDSGLRAKTDEEIIQQVLDRAKERAERDGRTHFSVGDLLLGLIEDKDPILVDALKSLNVDIEKLKEKITDLLQENDDQPEEETTG